MFPILKYSKSFVSTLKNISFTGIPLNQGQPKKGVSNGPRYFREAGGFKELQRRYPDINIVDNGDLTLANKANPDGWKSWSIDFITHVKDSIAAQAYDSESIPIHFGGDHSLAMGSISGFLQNEPKEDYCVIWIDAHPDCNTHATSPSKNMHGMPVTVMMGKMDVEGYESLSCIKPDQLIYLAIRDIDEGEYAFMDKYNVAGVTGAELKQHGLQYGLDKISEFIKGRKVYISWDIDSMDPSIITATGTRVENGLSTEDMKKLFKHLSQYDIRGMDVVEFNPELGDAQGTNKVILELLDYFISVNSKK